MHNHWCAGDVDHSSYRTVSLGELANNKIKVATKDFMTEYC